MLSTVVTIALVVAGAGVSALWFLRVLPTLGLSLRFAPALACYDGAAELERGLDILLAGLTATLPARRG